MNTEELVLLATSIAKEVGTEIYRLRTAGVQVSDTKSSLNDIVTEADKIAERMIVERITQARPDDAIYGEEGTRQSGTSGITWVIDPIDGTVNYLYDLAAYCVSIAACVEDETAFEDGRRAVAAAVYNPKTGELFYATEGAGAFLNDERIFVSKDTPLNQALVATGFGYTAERRLEQIKLLSGVIAEIRDIRRIGTAAYDLCLLAAGRIDAYFEKGIKPWDWAAGALIAREAGAVLLGKTATELPGETMFIAGKELLALNLQELLAV